MNEKREILDDMALLQSLGRYHYLTNAAEYS